MFEIIPPKTGLKSRPVGAGEVAISVRRGPAHRGHVLTFSMGQDLAIALDWRDGTKVVVAWGRDKALGKVKIGPAVGDGPSWEVRGNKARDVFKVYTGALPETFSGELYSGKRVVHEVIKTAATEPAPYLVVTLPKGFHEDLVRAMAHA